MIGCRPLDDAEISAILRALGSNANAKRDQALFVLGITTGFRISELLSVHVRDISCAALRPQFLRIPKSRMKGKRKSRSAVVAPIARPYLEARLDEMRLLTRSVGNLPVFMSRKNHGAISRVQAHRILATAFERADVIGAARELGTHCMRKTFAARMWEAHDGNIWKVQNALGHASPTSTVAYLSFNQDEQQAAVESAFASAF